MGYKRNTITSVYFRLELISDGSAVTTGTPTYYVSGIDAGGALATTFSGTGDGKVSHLSGGLWRMDLTAAMMNKDYVGLHITNGATNKAVFLNLPTDQYPDLATIRVPSSRVITLQQTSTGLVGEAAEVIQVDESKVYAVDFRKDMPTNGRFGSIVAVELQSGTAGGITFVAADAAVDRTRVNIKPTAVTAGDYVIRVQVTYESGEAAEGDVSMTVVV